MSRKQASTPRPILKRRGKSGIWQIFWTDPHSGTTKKLSTGTTDERTAQLSLVNFIDRLYHPVKPINQYSVNELMDAYIEEREGKAVISGLFYALKPIREFWGDQIVECINKVSVKQYIAKRMSENVVSGTIRKELTTLMAGLNLALRERKISELPQFDLPPKGAPREKWYTKDKAEKFLRETRYELIPQEDGKVKYVYSPDGVPHLFLYALITMSTLARNEAILELTWERVDFDSRLINFHNPDKVEKNKQRAIVPMNDRLYNALLMAKKVARTNFVIEYGEKPVKSVKKSFATAAIRAGMKGLTPNVLRHSGATWLAMAGVSMYQIAKLMGHANIKTTYKNYAKYAPDFLSDAINKLL